MVILILGLILIAIWAIRALIARRHNDRIVDKWLKSKEYTELMKARMECGYNRMTDIDDFIIWYTDDKLYPYPDADLRTAGIVIATIGMIVVLGFNTFNAIDYHTAPAQREQLIELRQSVAGNDIATLNTTARIIDFDSDVESSRHYQDHWYFKSHYWWCGDWYEIELID